MNQYLLHYLNTFLTYTCKLNESSLLFYFVSCSLSNQFHHFVILFALIYFCFLQFYHINNIFGMIHFIRHAQSLFNYEADEVLSKLGPQYKSTPQFLSQKFHPKYFDCGLTQIGRNQCLSTRQQMSSIDFDLVIVSPLRRTLQTCDIIFKDHKSKPKIIVDPGVREIFSSSCDIGTGLGQSIIDFPYFDFSLIKNIDYWYIDSIKNQQVRNHLLDQIGVDTQQSSAQLKKRAEQKMLEYLKQAYGKINQYSLSNFGEQKQKIKQRIIENKYKNIAIVSHHDNIWIYTNRKCQNGEVLKVSVDDL